MVYFACFDLSPKDKETMLKSIPKESYREVLRNMEYLDINLAMGKKFKRRHPEMTTEELNLYLKKHSQSKFDIVKCETKICKILRKMHAGTLDSNEYPFIGEKPMRKARRGGDDFVARGAKPVSQMGGKFKQSLQDVQNNPRLFVFVTGGLSHHEIVSISNLTNEIPAQIIPGSN